MSTAWGWITPAGDSIANTDLFRLATARSGEHVGEVKDVDGRVRVWAIADLPAIKDSGIHIMVGQSKGDLVAAANRRLAEDIAILAMVSLLASGRWESWVSGARSDGWPPWRPSSGWAT